MTVHEVVTHLIILLKEVTEKSVASFTELNCTTRLRTETREQNQNREVIL